MEAVTRGTKRRGSRGGTSRGQQRARKKRNGSNEMGKGEKEKS